MEQKYTLFQEYLEERGFEPFIYGNNVLRAFSDLPVMVHRDLGLTLVPIARSLGTEEIVYLTYVRPDSVEVQALGELQINNKHS